MANRRLHFRGAAFFSSILLAVCNFACAPVIAPSSHVAVVVVPTPVVSSNTRGLATTDAPRAHHTLAGTQVSSCAIVREGRVWCWGSNVGSALGHAHGGDGDLFDPAPVDGLIDVVEISAGDEHVCALRRTGTVACWGSNREGQLGNGGDGYSTIPLDIADLTDVVRIAAGGEHTCALRTSGEVVCWGGNRRGQSTGAAGSTSVHPTRVAGVVDVIDLSAGLNATCALIRSGEVMCWGAPSIRGAQSAAPAMLAGVRDATGLAVGAGMICVRRSDGQVSCLGDSRVGALGNPGITGTGAVPVPVTGIMDGREIAAGGSHACALRARGNVMCWGENRHGELGADLVSPFSATPLEVSGLDDALEIMVSPGGHTCARRRSGRVVCWGDNEWWALGVRSGANGHGPGDVAGVAGAVELAAGWHHACARIGSGDVMCWGGPLGEITGHNDRGDEVVSVPVSVAGLSDVAQIAVGGSLACARNTQGSVSCWGDASDLGSGHVTCTRTGPQSRACRVEPTFPGNPGPATRFAPPVATQGVTDAITISAGEFGACALHRRGTVSCWGAFESNELPHDPTPVVGLNDASALAVGGMFACVIRRGHVLCWGDPRAGRLGANSTTPRTTATAIAGISDAVELVAGWSHACVRTRTDNVLCWGEGVSGYGEPIADQSSVFRVESLRGALQLAAGEGFTCARQPSGSVRCIGRDSEGELGGNANGPINGLADVTSIAAGSHHACALRSDGRIACWGEDHWGELGDGRITEAHAPVAVVGLP